MPDLNWNLAQVPNLFGGAVQAARAGQQDRDTSATREAMTLYGSNPGAGLAALRPVDPDMAFRLEQQREAARVRDLAEQRDASSRAALDRAANGDFAAARQSANGDADTLAAIAKMDDRQREQARERAGVLVGVFSRAENMTPDQAEAYKRQIGPELVASGMFTAEQINGFRMTPENIAAQKAQALGLAGMLEEAWKERELGLREREQARREADTTADNARDQAKVGIARQNAATSAYRAHKAPAPRGRVLGATLDPNDGW